MEATWRARGTMDCSNSAGARGRGLQVLDQPGGLGRRAGQRLVQLVLGLVEHGAGACDLAFVAVAAEQAGQRHLHAQLQQPARGARVVVDEVPSVTSFLRSASAESNAACAACTRWRAASTSARCSGSGRRDVGRHAGPGLLDLEVATHADEAAQRQRGAGAVGLHGAQLGLGPARLDLGAQALLLGDVAGPLAPLRGRRQLLGALADGRDLDDALLRGQHVVEGGRHGQLLLHRDLVEVELRRVGIALGRPRAQLALVAAFVGPVEADRLVDALAAQHAAAADAVGQVDGAGLAGEDRSRRVVGRALMSARAAASARRASDTSTFSRAACSAWAA
jgi:hypothetical protein